MSNFKLVAVLLLIILLGGLLRFYKLESVPQGLHVDEAVQGYNAYSLLLTGKDEYGKAFPVFFRSFGYFQSPFYTYLTILPVGIFGLSVFSTRFISALAGVLVIILTFLILRQFKGRDKTIPLLATFTVAISPWSIFFSRMALEAHLGLLFMLFSFFILLRALNKPRLLLLAAFLLGLSAYTYHAERVLAPLYFFLFLIFFRSKFLQRGKIILLSITMLLILMIPQLILINSPGFSARFASVNYLSDDFYRHNGGNLDSFFLERYTFVLKEFTSRYIAYLSPRNLFVDSDPQGVWSMSDLSLFYIWMIIPFLFGLRFFIKNRSEVYIKAFILLLAVSLIPAALTREEFYTLRVMPAIWVITVIIAVGISELLKIKIAKYIKYSLALILIISSLAYFYVSYFVFFKYEKSDAFGYSYIELAKITEEMPNKHFLIDISRNPNIYILFAFFRNFDPRDIQGQPRSKIGLANYYNTAEGKSNNIEVENITTKPFVWGDDTCKDQFIVGDYLTISEDQAKRAGLRLAFEINPLDKNKRPLKAFQTDPRACL